MKKSMVYILALVMVFSLLAGCKGGVPGTTHTPTHTPATTPGSTHNTAPSATPGDELPADSPTPEVGQENSTPDGAVQ